MPTQLLRAPAAEPVTLAEAKAHMRVEINDDDALITGLLLAAREHVEDVTGRKLITQKWRLLLDRFTKDEVTYVFFNRLFVRSVYDLAANHLTPDTTRVIHLPMAPVQTVDLFNVIDQDGTTVAFDPANFVVDNVAEPGRIALKEKSDWPYPMPDLASVNGVQIDLTVGYGSDGSTVPERLKLAIKMLAAHWYENREDSSPLALRGVPMGVSALLQNFRIWARGIDA
jgi:uncharacterized phiE125 gp8 family phage protein